MSLQLRCNCGWTSQVSEFYLGDRVTCPDCGAKLEVHGQVGVPYGYAPYPTWQKRPRQATIRPARRRRYPSFAPANPHAGPALWLGLTGLALVTTGCGAVPGALLALFGVNSWSKSRQFARTYKQAHERRAAVGLGFSIVALLICVGMMISLFGGRNCSHRTHCRQEVKSVERTDPAPHEFRYEERDAEWYTRQAERFRAQEEEWRRLQQDNGYRYPTREAIPTPVQPRDDFQRKQAEYSEKVRREREGLKPQYRYGD